MRNTLSSIMRHTGSGLVTLLLVLLILALVGFWQGVEPRLIALAGAIAVAIWGALFFHAQRQALKGARTIADALRVDGQKHLASTRPDQRARVEALQHDLDEAMGHLRNAPGGRSALYTLPWVVVIGPPGSGKTTLLRESGIKFPSLTRGRIKLRGVGGTRNCDWWFADRGILLDTAGRYTTEYEDRDEWLAFLGMLRKARKRQPINGVVVAISLGDVVDGSDATLQDHADTIRERIAELTRTLGVAFPVYLVLTKSDQLPGFVEFFEHLGKTERKHIFGCTLPYARAKDFDLRQALDTEIDELYRQLTTRRIARFGTSATRRKDELAYTFPVGFTRAKQRIADFAQLLIGENPYEDSSPLRGCYFTSGTQEGSLIGQLMRELGEMAGIPIDVAEDQRKCYFVDDLFYEVIFADADLVQPTGAKSTAQRRRRRAAVAAAAGLAAVGIAGTAVHHARVSSGLATLEPSLEDWRKRFEPQEHVTDQQLVALEGLRNALADVPKGVDQELQGKLQQAYELGLKDTFVRLCAVELEEQFDKLATAPGPMPPASHSDAHEVAQGILDSQNPRSAFAAIDKPFDSSPWDRVIAHYSDRQTALTQVRTLHDSLVLAGSPFPTGDAANAETKSLLQNLWLRVISGERDGDKDTAKLHLESFLAAPLQVGRSPLRYGDRHKDPQEIIREMQRTEELANATDRDWKNKVRGLVCKKLEPAVIDALSAKTQQYKTALQEYKEPSPRLALFERVEGDATELAGKYATICPDKYSQEWCKDQLFHQCKQLVVEDYLAKQARELKDLSLGPSETVAAASTRIDRKIRGIAETYTSLQKRVATSGAGIVGPQPPGGSSTNGTLPISPATTQENQTLFGELHESLGDLEKAPLPGTKAYVDALRKVLHAIPDDPRIEGEAERCFPIALVDLRHPLAEGLKKVRAEIVARTLSKAVEAINGDWSKRHSEWQQECEGKFPFHDARDAQSLDVETFQNTIRKGSTYVVELDSALDLVVASQKIDMLGNVRLTDAARQFMEQLRILREAYYDLEAKDEPFGLNVEVVSFATGVGNNTNQDGDDIFHYKKEYKRSTTPAEYPITVTVPDTQDLHIEARRPTLVLRTPKFAGPWALLRALDHADAIDRGEDRVLEPYRMKAATHQAFEWRVTAPLGNAAVLYFVRPARLDVDHQILNIAFYRQTKCPAKILEYTR